MGSRLAFAGRRFHAWWEGYAFDEPAERAAILARRDVKQSDRRPADEIVAEAIWGEGRLEPGAPAWTMRFARMLSLPVRANIVVFGAGAGAPLDDIRHGTRWKANGFTRARHVSHGALQHNDKAMQRMHKATAAGAISFFDLHREANPSVAAGFAAELLLPGAKAAFVNFTVARRGMRLRACFPAAKHGAPKSENEYCDALREAGFSVGDISDETAAFTPLVVQGWAGWRRAFEAIGAVEDARGRARLLRAMSAHANMWAERCDALKSGHLRVVCMRASRN